jgi:hypothetical protein
MAPSLLSDALTEGLTVHEVTQALRAYRLTKADYAYRGIDWNGLTSQVAPPKVEPARVRFRDAQTGQWLFGISEPKIDPGIMRIDLELRAYEPCATKAHWRRRGGCPCAKRLVGMREGPANLLTNVFAMLTQVGVFGQTTTVTDTGGTGRSVTAVVLGGGMASKNGHAGTGVTAAAVQDTNMQTTTENVAATVGAVSGTGASATYTITYTVTAGAPRAYTEVGVIVTTTTNSWAFLVAHDSFSALNVSLGGTLATTYTITNS